MRARVLEWVKSRLLFPIEIRKHEKVVESGGGRKRGMQSHREDLQWLFSVPTVGEYHISQSQTKPAQQNAK